VGRLLLRRRRWQTRAASAVPLHQHHVVAVSAGSGRLVRCSPVSVDDVLILLAPSPPTRLSVRCNGTCMREVRCSPVERMNIDLSGTDVPCASTGRCRGRRTGSVARARRGARGRLEGHTLSGKKKEKKHPHVRTGASQMLCWHCCQDVLALLPSPRSPSRFPRVLT
jgi:hypothetical protein